MALSSMLDLALGLKQSLEDNVPALIDEVNAKYPNDNAPLDVPQSYLLGVRTDMIKSNVKQLPVMACGVYMREEEHEGEQLFSSVFMPYIVEAYLGGTDPDVLYIQSTKYAMVIDLWVERYASQLLFGFQADEAPDIDISYVLGPERDKTYRQLVAATGVFVGME